MLRTTFVAHSLVHMQLEVCARARACDARDRRQCNKRERQRERERERENENTAVKDTARSSGKPAVYSLDIDSAERFY